MSSRHSHRATTLALNPFVVLSDVVIVLLLILLLYFSALVYMTRQQKQGLVDEIQRLKLEQQQQVQKINEMRDFVALVRDDPTLKPYRHQIGILPREGNDEQVFTFGEEVLFERGKAEIPEGSAGRLMLKAFGEALSRRLNRVAQTQGHYPEIQVMGHTDRLPADNWSLSVNRALAVVKVLSWQKALKVEHLAAMGFSCHRPAVKPSEVLDRKAGDPKNRRIEIRLLYNLRPLRPKTFQSNMPYPCDCEADSP